LAAKIDDTAGDSCPRIFCRNSPAGDSRRRFARRVVRTLDRAADAGRIIRRGYFPVRCREHREQRFGCFELRKTWSRQTSRYDDRDRRPDCNEWLFGLLTSAAGLCQAARVLQLGPSTMQEKMRKLSRACELPEMTERAAM
tara:strand:- start:399 stop:821 length:423 start_codon:yes stop_codon:yes gene_type:complete